MAGHGAPERDREGDMAAGQDDVAPGPGDAAPDAPDAVPDDRIAPDPDMVFRSLAAPGMEEDEIFAALLGLPGKGAFWGDDHPSPYRPPEGEWSEEDERRRRREEILRRWDPDPT